MSIRTLTAIAVLSMVTLGCASKGDVRGAERERDAARAELKTAQAALASARAEREAAAQELRTAQADVAAKQREIDQLTTQVQAAETARDTAQAALDAATVDAGELARLRSQLATATAARDAAREALAAARADDAELTRLRSQLRAAEAARDAAQEALAAARAGDTDLAALRAQLATANAALTTARRDLAAANADRTALRGQVATLRARVAELEAAARQPVMPQPASVRIDETGTARRTGIATYSVVQIGGRFPGSFSGTRPVYAIDNWGFWGKKGDTTLFKVFIEEDDSLFATSDFALRVEGTRTGSNPVSGSATWTGSVRAYEAHPESLGKPVTGSARIAANLSAATVNVSFTGFTGGHANMAWSGLRMTNGVFSQRRGYTSIDGAFYGTGHEGAAGTFSRDRLDGVFGATRQ